MLDFHLYLIKSVRASYSMDCDCVQSPEDCLLNIHICWRNSSLKIEVCKLYALMSLRADCTFCGLNSILGILGREYWPLRGLILLSIVQYKLKRYCLCKTVKDWRVCTIWMHRGSFSQGATLLRIVFYF